MSKLKQQNNFYLGFFFQKDKIYMYIVIQWLVKHSKVCTTAVQNTIKGHLKIFTISAVSLQALWFNVAS